MWKIGLILSVVAALAFMSTSLASAQVFSNNEWLANAFKKKKVTSVQPWATRTVRAPKVKVKRSVRIAYNPAWCSKLVPIGGKVHMIVSLRFQVACLYTTDGTLDRAIRITTGTKKDPTPTGVFHTADGARDYRSIKLYQNKRTGKWERASMPCARRVVKGIFTHAGSIKAQPASHGCIRMYKKDACYVYDLPQGMRVDVRV